jgi:hypothetical protein
VFDLSGDEDGGSLSPSSELIVTHSSPLSAAANAFAVALLSEHGDLARSGFVASVIGGLAIEPRSSRGQLHVRVHSGPF